MQNEINFVNRKIKNILSIFFILYKEWKKNRAKNKSSPRNLGGIINLKMKWNFKRLPWKKILPIILSCCVGLGAGLSIYTFIYAKGYSYLSNNPEACANCHIMNDQYNGWIKSSHHTAATCNDCHTPHHLLGKYKTKASNGFWHSFYFTTGNFKEPIQIKTHNKEITENNCRRCHQEIVMAMDGPHKKTDRLSCVQCHGSVGHP